MIHAGCGLSMLEDTAEAAAQATAQALRGMEPQVADIAFVFATSAHAKHLQPAVARVREMSLARHLVGCLGYGVFSLDADVEGGAGLAVLLVQGEEALRFSPFKVDALEDQSEAGGEKVGRQMRSLRGEQGLLVLLADVHAFHPTPFFEGLERGGNEMAVVGGASCDDGTLHRAYQFFGDTVLSQGACGVAMHGGFRPTVVVNQACLPVGPALTVTRARGPIVFELQGKRALEPFVEFVNEHLQGDLQRAGRVEVALSEEVIDEDGSAAAAGEAYYVRSVVGLDPEHGVLALSEPVHEGQKLHFTLRDPERAASDMRARLDSLGRSRHKRPPAFGLYFNCAGRTSGFFGSPSLDTTLIRDMLGDFPLVGFYGGAELAPLAGRNRANYFSGVLVLADDPEQGSDRGEGRD